MEQEYLILYLGITGRRVQGNAAPVPTLLWYYTHAHVSGKALPVRFHSVKNTELFVLRTNSFKTLTPFLVHETIIGCALQCDVMAHRSSNCSFVPQEGNEHSCDILPCFKTL